MLVYATKLRLEKEGADTREAALSAVREWISFKCRVPMEELQFADGAHYAFAGSKRVDAWSTSADSDEHPRVNAIRFTHPDTQVHGRLWVTEVGIAQAESDGFVDATVVLSVNDVSTQVDARVAVSRPGVVANLAKQCKVVPPTPNGQLRLLKDGDIETFRATVEHPTRRHAIVLVSPDKFTENPLVERIRCLARLMTCGCPFEQDTAIRVAVQDSIRELLGLTLAGGDRELRESLTLTMPAIMEAFDVPHLVGGTLKGCDARPRCTCPVWPGVRVRHWR